MRYRAIDDDPDDESVTHLVRRDELDHRAPETEEVEEAVEESADEGDIIDISP